MLQIVYFIILIICLTVNSAFSSFEVTTTTYKPGILRRLEDANVTKVDKPKNPKIDPPLLPADLSSESSSSGSSSSVSGSSESSGSSGSGGSGGDKSKPSISGQIGISLLLGAGVIAMGAALTVAYRNKRISRPDTHRRKAAFNESSSDNYKIMRDVYILRSSAKHDMSCAPSISDVTFEGSTSNISDDTPTSDMHHEGRRYRVMKNGAIHIV